MIKKFLGRKVGGYIVTLELCLSVVCWSWIMSSCVYLIDTQITQKYMYNAFISVAMETSKWGGTYSNLYLVNGKEADLGKNMQAQLREITGQNVTIVATPTKVTTGNDKIRVTLTWEDRSYRFFKGKTHTLNVELDSIVRPGSLL